MEQQINNGYDFGNAHDPNISILLATTSDELGSVLRAHFCLEEFLDVWCNTITGVKDFLDIGFLGFDKKLAIAKKLGLGDDQALAFKEFNKLDWAVTKASIFFSLLLNSSLLSRVKLKTSKI